MFLVKNAANNANTENHALIAGHNTVPNRETGRLGPTDRPPWSHFGPSGLFSMKRWCFLFILSFEAAALSQEKTTQAALLAETMISAPDLTQPRNVVSTIGYTFI